MQSKEEVRKLKEELERVTGFIGDFGTDKDIEDRNFTYACDVLDTLEWVSGEITTDDFLSDSYLNMEALKRLVREIEKRTGKKFEGYE